MAKVGELSNTPAHGTDDHCPHCTFLGSVVMRGEWVNQDGKPHPVDLTHCLQMGKVPTLVARFSADGPDYTTGGVYSIPPDGTPLAVARQLAIARGLSLA